MNFIVSTYDLKNGRVLETKEFDNLADATTEYALAVECLGDVNVCPFGVLMYTANGNIVYGLNEPLKS